MTYYFFLPKQFFHLNKEIYVYIEKNAFEIKYIHFSTTVTTVTETDTFGFFTGLPAAQPLDGSFGMEEGGHMEGVWGQLYPHSSPSPDSP